MIISALRKIAGGGAAPTMILRVAIVGGNFVIMIGLAALLGLEAFGQLMVSWGLALVAGTVMSAGAPLVLLRGLTDGGTMSWRAIATQVLLYPVLIGAVGLLFLSGLPFAVDWVPILFAGFCINLLTCVATILRALRSLQWSMALRDAGPQCALGLTALLHQGPFVDLRYVALVLVMMAALAWLWCVSHPRLRQIIGEGSDKALNQLPLWGTSVAGMVLAQVDIIIGGSVLSDADIGLYALLRRVANLVALPVTVATWVSAAPISAAHGAGDLSGLRRASDMGNRIALFPGIALCVAALVLLPMFDVFATGGLTRSGQLAYLILIFGAMMQVILASSFTVATLCGLAGYAAASRVFSILAYVLVVAFAGPALGLTSHALIVVAALTGGNVFLWYGIRLRLGLDTSAVAILRAGGVGWKAS